MKSRLLPVSYITLFLAASCGGQPAGGAHDACTKKFEPGNISTGSEYGVTFSPDSEVMYFTRGDDIYWSKKVGGEWSTPQLAAFSDGSWTSEYAEATAAFDYFNWDPVFSPDGSKLFIMSHGLVDGKIIDGEDGDIDLWMMRRERAGYEGDVWGEPENLGLAVNTPDHTEGAAGVASNGDVYFFSRNRQDSVGGSDMYYAPFEAGELQPAVHLGPVLNTPEFDGHTYVDPDGKFLLFINIDRPGGAGDCDIYASVRTAPGWGVPINLGPNVNTDRCEITPSLSPDGETLFFARIEDRETDERNIYAVKLGDTNFPLRRQPSGCVGQDRLAASE